MNKTNMSFLQGILTNANGAPPGQMNPQQIQQAHGLLAGLQQPAPQAPQAATQGQWGNGFAPAATPALGGPIVSNPTKAPVRPRRRPHIPRQRPRRLTRGAERSLPGIRPRAAIATRAIRPVGMTSTARPGRRA